MLILILIDGLFNILNLVNGAPINNRPIYAVLAQEFIKDSSLSIIVASYVKFLEAGGARVVPVFIHQPDDYYRKLFYSTNGAVFPGSNWTPNSTFMQSGYAKAAHIFFDLAVEANNKGDYYPIWGSCMGLELLAIFFSNGSNPLTKCSALDLLAPLEFTLKREETKKTKLFHEADDKTLDILQNQNSTIGFHEYCLTVDTFKRSPLKDIIVPISLNFDFNGTKFISNFEAKHYPFYGLQIHPEYVLFEFEVMKEQKNVPHDVDSVYAAQYFSRFFVNEARKSKHAFPSKKEEKKALIYNYIPTYEGIYDDSYDEQIYIFK